MVEDAQVQVGSLGISAEEFAGLDLLSGLSNVCQEVTVRLGAVSSELMKDLGQGVHGHRDLAKVVQKGDL